MLNKINNLKIRVTALSLAAISTFTLAGCDPELAPEEEYDTISQTSDDFNLSNGLVQEIEVPNNDFKLITEYSCDDELKRKLNIIADDLLYIETYTEGLDEGTIVYINNVHINTLNSKYSHFVIMEGISPNTRVDNVHHSKTLGYPISNNISYFVVSPTEDSNKIQVVYDLLIKKKDEKDFSNVSVSTDFVVEVSNLENENTNEKSTKQKTYSK